MSKIAFIGAGSTVFAKNVLGDVMMTDRLRDSHIALYDIDPQRLEDSRLMLANINRNVNEARADISAHLGVGQRRAALSGADYIVIAIQVGGYRPATVTDFEVPKKYGLRQTIGDTLGIGGIFRALRTIPVVLDIARDIEAVCPDAWVLNYVNPVAMVTGAMLRASEAKTVGLCHSVQVAARQLLEQVGMFEQVKDLRWQVAGVNHQAWLLEVTDGGKDLYPQIKQRASEKNRQAKIDGAPKHSDMVRLELMLRFGYYQTESSEHAAEYVPWFIKSTHPELIDQFNIPLDEYPRRCVEQIDQWQKRRQELVDNAQLTHQRTGEYAAGIMQAIEAGEPYHIHGNVLNDGLIDNLPRRACVEVPCVVDGDGIRGCGVGELPPQCAALNRTNINVQLLTIEAALTGKKDYIYQAAMLDPHTGAELTIDEIVSLCDDLIDAHGPLLGRLE